MHTVRRLVHIHYFPRKLYDNRASFGIPMDQLRWIKGLAPYPVLRCEEATMPSRPLPGS